MQSTKIAGYSDVFNTAFEYQRATDRPMSKKVNIDIDTWNNYKTFLRLRCKNPTCADIAYKEVQSRKSVAYPENVAFFRTIFEKAPDVKVLVEEAAKKIKTLYPKTAKIREKLINTNRITLLGTIKPKLNIANKILLTVLK